MHAALSFTLSAQSGPARCGCLVTPHGEVETPCFMPVGTHAAVKGMTPAALEACGARILLANTYHLAVRPGEDLVRRAGGVAAFMGWPGPTLTDSGGYQVFSLAANRTLTDEGVFFRNHIDGAAFALTP
jgi:queuine tRNA-ribosyltransferase